MHTLITILFSYLIGIPFAYMALKYVMSELGFSITDKELNKLKWLSLLSWVAFVAIITVLTDYFKD